VNVVELSHVSKSFGDLRAVDDVSFSVAPGEIFGLLGPNGAGKTTTLRMILDIFKPDSGQIAVFGGPITEAKKERIGYLPEERGLYKEVRLETVLVYLATLKGMDPAAARRRTMDFLERLDLLEHRHKKVGELSRGMQQKAQIIATLVHDPDLIIVDEPFAGLDPVNTRLVKAILQELRDQGKTVMMSTHQMHQVEALCDRIILINRGQVVLDGRVDEVKRRFAGNAVIVAGRGDFASLPGVLRAERQDSVWTLTLAPGTTPQAVMRLLAERDDLLVERFEVALPSLDDIFVTVVAGEQGTGG